MTTLQKSWQNKLFETLKKYGVLEFVRSGRISVSRSKRKTETFLEELEKSTTHSLSSNNGTVN